MSINWGDVPTWVSAVTTITATAGAGWAAYATWGVLKLERTRDEEAAKVNRQQLANGVSAWLDYEAGNLTNEYGLEIRNMSGQPISSFEVIVHVDHEGDIVVHRRRIVPPGEDRVPVSREAFHAIRKHLGVKMSDLFSSVGIILTFRDAAGVEWRRTESGLLIEL